MKKFVLIFSFFLLGACVSREEMIRRHNEMIQSIEDKYDGLDREMLEFERDILSDMLEKEQMVDRARSSANFTSGIFSLIVDGSSGDMFSEDKTDREADKLRSKRKPRLEAINNLLDKKPQQNSPFGYAQNQQTSPTKRKLMRTSTN